MTTLAYTDLQTARRFVDVVLSLSQLGLATYGRPIVLANYTDVTPTLSSADAIEAAIDEVEDVVAGSADAHPRRYMAALVRGARTVLADLRGDDLSYGELVAGCLEIDHRPVPESETRRLRHELHEGLGLLGYDGSLERQVEAWLAATSVTGDDVIRYGRSILARAREATERTVVTLPPGEGIDDFGGVRDVHYSGKSRYVGDYRGTLEFNVDKFWQRDLFVHVLTHEAYPGHQTFYALWDHLYRQGAWPMEAAFYQLNGPTNAVFEGGPEASLHFLGWDAADTDEALRLRVALAYMDLGRVAMNDACLWCNSGAMTKDEAVALMVEHFVLPDDAERAHRFFTSRQSRANYAQYYYGRRIVKLAYERFEHSETERQRFFDLIYRTPHTTSTFVQAVADASGAPFDPFSYT